MQLQNLQTKDSINVTLKLTNMYHKTQSIVCMVLGFKELQKCLKSRIEILQYEGIIYRDKKIKKNCLLKKKLLVVKYSRLKLLFG